MSINNKIYNITKDLLIEQYTIKNYTQKQIAGMFGCSTELIGHYLKIFGVSRGNSYVDCGGFTKLIINSRKYGKHQVLVDTRYVAVLKQVTWSVYQKKRNARFYVHGWHNGKSIDLHKFLGNIIGITNCVDHKNRDTLDNRICNLRSATIAENNRNKGVTKRNTSGIVGVYSTSNGKKWVAELRSSGVKYTKYFSNKAQAIAARKAMELKTFGEFSPNFSV